MRRLRDILDGPFATWLGDDDWTPWISFLSALRAEPMITRSERRIYRECTGRTDLPTEPFNEAWVVVGRRGRKSAIAAVLAVYFAVYLRWPRAAGETVRVLVVAVSKDQAAIVRAYAEAILESRPGLRRMIESSDAESISLTNGIVIQCVANSFRSIRGPTVVCAVFEEVAYWRDENSANPDKEILRAVRPSMLTAPGALLLGISSPYAKRGLLYERYREHFGKDGSRVLVWQAPTETMNPQVDADAIADAYAEDPVAAAAEYGAQFRDDLEAYVSREAVDACVEPGCRERRPLADIDYVAFVDPAGGSGRDAMTLAVGHLEGDTAVLDCIRERKPPFSPTDVVAEFAITLRAYSVREVVGDRFAGEWAREPFRDKGIEYRLAPKPKSDLYRDLLPAIMSRTARLLDHPKLVSQLTALERRTARGGRDSIDHPPNAHDDIANVCAGVMDEVLADARRPKATASAGPKIIRARPEPRWIGGETPGWVGR